MNVNHIPFRELNTVTIDGKTFSYQVFKVTLGLFSDNVIRKYTEFYLGEETIIRRKYFLFGEKVTNSIPKFVFKINVDIGDPHFSKDDIAKLIREKIALLERLEEIKRGEIV